MKKTVLAGAAQIGTDSDISANFEKILAMIGRAPEAGCELLLFHEGCLTGYPDKEALARLDFERVAEAEEEIDDTAETPVGEGDELPEEASSEEDADASAGSDSRS